MSGSKRFSLSFFFCVCLFLSTIAIFSTSINATTSPTFSPFSNSLKYFQYAWYVESFSMATPPHFFNKILFNALKLSKFVNVSFFSANKTDIKSYTILPVMSLLRSANNVFISNRTFLGNPLKLIFGIFKCGE